MKTQEEEIQKLKELACAHDVALYYDHIPSVEDVSESDRSEFSFNNNLLSVICRKYNGFSCDD